MIILIPPVVRSLSPRSTVIPRVGGSIIPPLGAKSPSGRLVAIPRVVVVIPSVMVVIPGGSSSTVRH